MLGKMSGNPVFVKARSNPPPILIDITSDDEEDVNLFVPHTPLNKTDPIDLTKPAEISPPGEQDVKFRAPKAVADKREGRKRSLEDGFIDVDSDNEKNTTRNYIHKQKKASNITNSLIYSSEPFKISIPSTSKNIPIPTPSPTMPVLVPEEGFVAPPNNDHVKITENPSFDSSANFLQELVEAGPVRKTRSITRYTKEQINVLTAAFSVSKKLKALHKIDLPIKTGLPLEKIQSWFAQQRRKEALMEVRQRKRFAPSHDAQHAPQHHHLPEQEFIHSPNKSNNAPPTTAERVKNNPEETQTKNDQLSDEEIANKITAKMDLLQLFGIKQILATCRKVEEDVHHLYDLRMDEKLGVRCNISCESKRLEEKCSRSSPFSAVQQNAIKEWRKMVLKKKIKKLRHLEKTKRKDLALQLKAADSIIVSAWAPVLVYSKLFSMNLEAVIRDFTFDSRHREMSNQYKVIEALRASRKQKLTKKNKQNASFDDINIE